MSLPFRYQFLLAPAIIILLLAGLVTYTLIELPRINREHDITVQSELAKDRALVMIASTSHLDQLAQRMIASPSERDNLLFDYMEQTQIYLDNAQHPDLLARAPENIRHIILDSTARLRDAEHIDPRIARATLGTLIPALKQLSIGFQSQRRDAYLEYHRNLSIIVTQLINASLTVLTVCIVLGVGLATWGLHVTRVRLAALTQRAHRVCGGDLARIRGRDELDTLDLCLTTMTQRLIDTLSTEKLIQGAEDERRRIAMDMHDGVLADLTVLSRTLDQAEQSQASTPPINKLRADVTQLAESIRRVIDDLHPQSLDVLGLEAALRAFLSRHCSAPMQPGYHIEFASDAENALRPAQKIHLFRIASEAIHNVIRHAQCSHFEISIRVVGQQLLCTVEDNGIGMPTTPSLGHGCLNITERARAIGALASWSPSRFSSGTRFALRLPRSSTPCPA